MGNVIIISCGVLIPWAYYVRLLIFSEYCSLVRSFLLSGFSSCPIIFKFLTTFFSLFSLNCLLACLESCSAQRKEGR